MESLELINLSQRNSVGAKIGLEPKPDLNSFAYSNIMEKALVYRENRETARNIDKKKNVFDFNSLSRTLAGNQQVCSNKDNDNKACEDSAPLEDIADEDITKEEKNLIDSIMAMLSGLLNLSRQEIDGIRDILSNQIEPNMENESIRTSIMNEIYTIVQSDELLNKKDFEHEINLLATLKQNLLIAKNSTDELNLDDNGLKEASGLNEDKNAHRPGLIDSNMLDSRDEEKGKIEINRPAIINTVINNEVVNNETEDIEQSDSDNNTGKNIGNKYSKENQIKKVDSAEKRSAIDKIIEPIRTEYITTDEKNFTIDNDSKPIEKSLEYLDKTQNISKEELFSQIIENSKVIENQDFSEIRIQLKPDSLGKLTIRLIMEKGEMTAKFIAENHRVKESIESNFSELKDSLSQKGINIQNLSVSVGQQGTWQYENKNLRAWKNDIKRSGYIGDADLELEGETSAYRNPYSLNQGSVDIKV